MTELVQKIVSQVGLSEEQATQAVAVAREYILGKVPPMMHGVIDNFLSGNSEALKDSLAAVPPVEQPKSLMDELKDVADKAKEGISDFAKNAGNNLSDLANKAEDMAGDAIDKVKGFIKKDDNKAS